MISEGRSKQTTVFPRGENTPHGYLGGGTDTVGNWLVICRFINPSYIGDI